MSATPAPARRPDAPTGGQTAPPAAAPPDEAVAAFEAVYRANVAAITGYFARRCADPQSVADLTSETFVQAIGSLRSFDPRRGTARAWLFGIRPSCLRARLRADRQRPPGCRGARRPPPAR